MKLCPICKARCFEDMDICYGCMHQFNLATEQPLMRSPVHSDSPDSTNTIRLPLIQEGAKLEKEKLQAEYQLIISLEPVKQTIRLS